MADLMTTIGLDDREFRAGAARVKKEGASVASQLVRGFVGMETIKRMIRGAAEATREYAKENAELVRGFNELSKAGSEFSKSLGRDLAGAGSEGTSILADLVRAASTARERTTNFFGDLFAGEIGTGRSAGVDQARKDAEASVLKSNTLREIFKIQSAIAEETARITKDEAKQLQLSELKRQRRITDFENTLSPEARDLVSPQLVALRSQAAAASAAEARAAAGEKAKKEKEFSERVRDDNLRRSAQVMSEKAEARRLAGDTAGAGALELDARKMQIAADRARALREIENAELDPATKAALRAETERSFGELDAATVIGNTPKSKDGASRSLAAGFSDFASQVFGQSASLAGLGKGDMQKQIVRTGQDQLQETRKQTGHLVQIADLLVGVGTLR